jgi:hypothetical protein
VCLYMCLYILYVCVYIYIYILYVCVCVYIYINIWNPSNRWNILSQQDLFKNTWRQAEDAGLVYTADVTVYLLLHDTSFYGWRDTVVLIWPA